MQCIKCSNEDINTSYHKATSYSTECNSRGMANSEEEHLHYHCRSCGYDWIQPCDDAKVS